MTTRWVRRDWDKPHRCPLCHTVAERAWSSRGYGPRTQLRCLAGCDVRWRSGTRQKPYSRGFKQLLAALGWAELIEETAERGNEC